MDVKTRIDQMPSSFRLSYEKSRKSKAFAIKSMCVECSGYDRKAVGTCSDEGCPLWPHRPYQKKGSEDTEELIEPEDLPPQICDHLNIQKSDDAKVCMDCGKRWKKKKKEEANVTL